MTDKNDTEFPDPGISPVDTGAHATDIAHDHSDANVFPLHRRRGKAAEPAAARPHRSATQKCFKDERHAIEFFNRRYAVIIIGGKTRILRHVYNHTLECHDIDLLSPGDFKAFYANTLINDGVKPACAATRWLRSPLRTSYHDLLFRPDGETPDGCYNLWSGFAVEPRAGDCEPFLAHVRENIADGDEAVYEYFLDWMADLVQNPSRRPGVSLVLRGAQGTGKGQFAHHLGRLLGPRHYTHVSHGKHLTGRFNAHLKDTLLLFADEAVWGGDKQAEGVLKALVTEPTLMVEMKHVDPIPMKNYVRLIIASNHEWAAPAGIEERRFCVLDVGEKRIQDSRYFASLNEHMEKKGGYEALLHFLLTRDLSAADLRNFPRTQALLETKLLSMSPEERFWHTCLLEGRQLLSRITDAPETRVDRWLDIVPTAELTQELAAFCKIENSNTRSLPTRLGLMLNKRVPDLQKERLRLSAYADKRTWVWRFPDLQTCRQYFERHAGQRLFPEEGPDPK
jgi:hypothetical protein